MERDIKSPSQSVGSIFMRLRGKTASVLWTCQLCYCGQQDMFTLEQEQGGRFHLVSAGMTHSSKNDQVIGNHELGNEYWPVHAACSAVVSIWGDFLDLRTSPCMVMTIRTGPWPYSEQQHSKTWRELTLLSCWGGGGLQSVLRLWAGKNRLISPVIGVDPPTPH